jgi:hypothetical protein
LIVEDIVKHGESRVVAALHAHHAEETEHSEKLEVYRVGVGEMMM